MEGLSPESEDKERHYAFAIAANDRHFKKGPLASISMMDLLLLLLLISWSQIIISLTAGCRSG